MSEPLYRIDYEALATWVQRLNAIDPAPVEILAAWKAAGVLVPVEPNYEAAEAAWQTMFPCVCGPEYTERKLISPHCLHHDEKDSGIIVDAALGEPA